MQSELLTLKEVGHLLKVDPRTIRRWMRTNKLRYLKIRGTVRVMREDLEESGVRLKPLVPKKPDPGKIYFIQAAASRAVKIGWCGAELAARIAMIQTHNHENLILLGTIVGSRVREKRLHRKMRNHRIHGEWFSWCPQIEKLIKNALKP